VYAVTEQIMGLADKNSEGCEKLSLMPEAKFWAVFES
jgi:hypothetical protein